MISLLKLRVVVSLRCHRRRRLLSVPALHMLVQVIHVFKFAPAAIDRAFFCHFWHIIDELVQ